MALAAQPAESAAGVCDLSQIGGGRLHVHGHINAMCMYMKMQLSDSGRARAKQEVSLSRIYTLRVGRYYKMYTVTLY